MYSTKTYLKDVLNHELKIHYDEKDNYYIVVKKIVDIKEAFTLIENKRKVTILNDNYYILEYIPKNDNFICRMFIDDQKSLIEKMFRFTRKNDVKDRIPIYDDLKLSYVIIDDYSTLYNMDKFNELRENNIIDDYTYDSTITKIEKIKNIELPFNYKDYLD